MRQFKLTHIIANPFWKLVSRLMLFIFAGLFYSHSYASVPNINPYNISPDHNQHIIQEVVPLRKPTSSHETGYLIPSTWYIFESTENPGEKILDVSNVEVVNPESISKDDVAKVIPTNIQSGSDEVMVSRKVLDYSVNNFLNSPNVKNSSVGRTADSVQKAMQAEVSFGNHKKGSIEHHLNLQMQAFEQVAYLHYSGYADADVKYFIVPRNTTVEVVKNLASTTSLVYDYLNSDVEARNTISMRWIWN